jgi:methane/ammonia monooxygenase subunit B
MSLLRAAAAGLVVGILAVVTGPASVAGAHGEQTQEAFLRASTVLLYDVKFSDTHVAVGEPVTITGKVRIMNAWPEHTIPAPHTGFLSIIAPGPVFSVQDRQLSGQFTPQSVRIHKGQTFPFSVTVVARDEGHWHVHPSFAVKGAGTLVGRGEWIDVGPGEFHNTATLASGDKVDLTDYGTPTVVIWHAIALLIGLGWLVFWLRRPVLTRLPVVSDGHGKSLTSMVDVKVGLGFVALVVVVLAGGYAYATSSAASAPLPLQVARISPTAAAEPDPLVDSEVTRAQYREATRSLVLTVKVGNTSDTPVTLTAMQVAEETLVPRGQHPRGAVPALRITGPTGGSASGDSGYADSGSAGTVAAGEERTLTVTIDAKPLLARNLLPLQEPQVRITGLFFFSDSAGHRQVSEVDEVSSPILPA